MFDLDLLSILLPALAAGILVLSTHVVLGQQVLKRGIIFIDLAIAHLRELGINNAILNAGGDLDGTSSGLIDPQTLQTTVAAIVRRNPSIQVLVGGDEGASYGQVYGALALLQAAGVSKVGLMSDPAELGYGGASPD